MRPTDDKPASPAPSPAGAEAADARAQRLSQALRENLKRRKAQARGRADEPRESATDKDPPAGESA
jgi:hypothetical protein